MPVGIASGTACVKRSDWRASASRFGVGAGAFGL
jgi:hypothetical protein